MRAARTAGVHAAALCFFTALAVAYLWPLPRHLGTHWAVRTLDAGSYVGDLHFSAWILASDVHRLVRDPLHVFETNNLHPFRHTLAYGENMLGVAGLVLPVQLLWDNPILTFNVAVLATLVLLGWGTFLLVRELGGSALAGVLGGALALYSPAVWSEIILLPLLAAHWTPIALFLLVRLIRAPSARAVVLLAVAVALQAWSSLQHGLFIALGLGTTAAVLLVLSRAARRAVLHLAAAGVLAAVLLVPLVLPYRAVRSEMDAEGRQGAMAFSLTLDRLRPPVDRPLAYLADRARSGDRIQGFATLVPWLLLGAGGVAAVLVRRPRRLDGAVLVALAAGGTANVLYALGPINDPWIPSLYRALSDVVPGLAWVRVPMRAVASAYLFQCALAGCGAAALLARIRRPAVRLAVAGAVLALIVVEAGWRPVLLLPTPPRATALAAALGPPERPCPIAEIPAEINACGEALLRSTAHWHPVIDGFSGFYPIAPLVTYALLNQFPSPDALAFVRAAGGCAVVARPPLAGPVRAASVAAGLPVEAAGPDVVVRVPPAAAPPEGPALPRARWRVTPESGPDGPAVLDDDLETLWHGTVRDELGPDHLTVDLGEPVAIAAVGVDLGHHVTLYLRNYRVQGSLDGATWTTLAESPLAVPPLASYRADFRRVRQRIDFATATVRWLRVGPYRRPPRTMSTDTGWTGWAVAELHAFAPPD